MRDGTSPSRKEGGELPKEQKVRITMGDPVRPDPNGSREERRAAEREAARQERKAGK